MILAHGSARDRGGEGVDVRYGRRRESACVSWHALGGAVGEMGEKKGVRRRVRRKGSGERGDVKGVRRKG